MWTMCNPRHYCILALLPKCQRGGRVIKNRRKKGNKETSSGEARYMRNAWWVVRSALSAASAAPGALRACGAAGRPRIGPSAEGHPLGAVSCAQRRRSARGGPPRRRRAGGGLARARRRRWRCRSPRASARPRAAGSARRAPRGPAAPAPPARACRGAAPTRRFAWRTRRTPADEWRGHESASAARVSACTPLEARRGGEAEAAGVRGGSAGARVRAVEAWLSRGIAP